MRLKITAFKNYSNGYQYTTTNEDENFIFSINSYPQIEKQSNQD